MHEHESDGVEAAWGTWVAVDGGVTQRWLLLQLHAASVVLTLVMTSGVASAQKYPAVTPDPTPDPGTQPTTDPSSQPASTSDDDDDDDDGGGGSGGAQKLMPPATKPWFFTGGVGPTFFNLTKSPDRNAFGRSGRFHLALDLGYHLDGTFEGPALGLSIEQSFDENLYVFNPSFKFLWDIQVVDDLAIYVAPFGKAGYALGAARGGPYHGLNLGFGAEGRVVFNDFAMAYFRPVQLDTYLGDFFDEVFMLHYTVLIGGGLTF